MKLFLMFLFMHFLLRTLTAAACAAQHDNHRVRSFLVVTAGFCLTMTLLALYFLFNP